MTTFADQGAQKTPAATGGTLSGSGSKSGPGLPAYAEQGAKADAAPPPSPTRSDPAQVSQLYQGMYDSGGAPASDRIPPAATPLLGSAELGAQVEQLREQNLLLREERDALSPEDAAQQAGLESSLTQGRMQMIGLLQQRLSALDAEMAALRVRATVTAMAPGGGDAQALRDQIQVLSGERAADQQHLDRHVRWRTRQEIEAMNAQIEALDAQIEALGGDEPEVQRLREDRDGLRSRRRELVEGLNDDVVRFTQGGGAPWARAEYRSFDEDTGAPEECGGGQSTMAYAGCGPTSLAMILNHLAREDPEGIRSEYLDRSTPEERLDTSGEERAVTPWQTRDYAENTPGARVCGHGTQSEAFEEEVAASWPGYQGRNVSSGDVREELRRGHLLVFHSDGIDREEREAEGERGYGGHYMVLTGISEDGSTVFVLDPGSHDIRELSLSEVRGAESRRFWVIESR